MWTRPSVETQRKSWFGSFRQLGVLLLGLGLDCCTAAHLFFSVAFNMLYVRLHEHPFTNSCWRMPLQFAPRLICHHLEHSFFCRLSQIHSQHESMFASKLDHAVRAKQLMLEGPAALKASWLTSWHSAFLTVSNLISQDIVLLALSRARLP